MATGTTSGRQICCEFPCQSHTHPYQECSPVCDREQCNGQASFTVNPARDLGPRIFAAMIGYGAHPFHLFSWRWAWGTWGGTIAGGIAGALVYDLFVFTGSESPVNYPDKSYVEQRIGKLLHNDSQISNVAKSTTILPDQANDSSDTLVRNGKAHSSRKSG